jgi:hypothetical protein
MVTMILLQNHTVPQLVTSALAGSCYRIMYDVLIKNKREDMLLPCIVAIDKTVCDIGGSYGWLSVEPVIVSYGRFDEAQHQKAPACYACARFHQ